MQSQKQSEQAQTMPSENEDTISINQNKRERLLREAQATALLECNVKKRVLRAIVNDAVNSIL